MARLGTGEIILGTRTTFTMMVVMVITAFMAYFLKPGKASAFFGRSQ